MAGTKISALTAAAALGGTEEIPGVQSAANVKITAAQIKTFTSASPTLVTPVLGVAAGTSLALGGATIGSNALAVTGTTNLNGNVAVAGSGTLVVASNITSNAGYFWSKTDGTFLYAGSGADLIVTRPAAATFQHGNADAASPVAQTIKFQDVVAGTTNTAGVNATIQAPAGTGTGAGGSLIFQVAAAGSSGTAKNAWATAWLMNSSGHLLAGTDNIHDIGANATNRPRSIYAATKVFAGNGVETNGALNGFNFTSRGYILAPADGVFKLSNNADNDFSRLQFGGTTSTFPAIKRSTASLQARLADDSAFTNIQGKLTTDTAYTAGDPTTTGYLVVYDSTGTAYRVPALLN